ncbi:MAG: hypothetical protein ACRDQ0_12725, partial [Pseudonocardia sp.]
REPRQAARALLAAEDALIRDDGPQPTYSAVAGPAPGTVASHTARALTDMGDHAGTAAHHRAALQKWDLHSYKRVHILTHADLGDSLAALHRPDEAVASWARALDLAGPRTASTRP